MNLVINAAEATGPQGGHVRVATAVRDLDREEAARAMAGFAIPPGRYVELTVADNGQGMDAATATCIFDPFFTTKFTGRGLGLAAVSGIVRGHKAGLALASEPGRGTQFRVWFPASLAEMPTPAEPSAIPASRGAGTILVVDDEPVVSRTARLALQKSGFTVLMAVNGREAVDMFAAPGPHIDLVLLDMAMPVMSGDVAFRQLRLLRPDVPVIASSGYDESEAFSRFGNHLDGFLQKPYRASGLVEAVRQVLARRMVIPK